MKKIGVILSGCGVSDGTEIHEAVLTLLAIDKAGAQAVCIAPSIPQTKVTNHITKEEMAETRNVLLESARIARGEIRDLAQVKASELDAIVIPGGFGAALNLSDFAMRGVEARVNPDLERLVREMLEQRKPIGAICIAPAPLARILQKAGVSARLTIGTDKGTAGAIQAMGQVHVECPPHEAVVDEEHRIVTSPAYMSARRISEVAAGVESAVTAILKMA